MFTVAQEMSPSLKTELFSFIIKEVGYDAGKRSELLLPAGTGLQKE
jgi:hypothetical protein